MSTDDLIRQGESFVHKFVILIVFYLQLPICMYESVIDVEDGKVRYYFRDERNVCVLRQCLALKVRLLCLKYHNILYMICTSIHHFHVSSSVFDAHVMVKLAFLLHIISSGTC